MHQQQQSLKSSTRLENNDVSGQQALSYDTTEFLVETIQLQGNKQLLSTEYTDILSSFAGKLLSLRDLQSLCLEISRRYQQRGYLFTRAIIPEQTLTQGRLKLQVIEARLGELAIENNSRVDEGFLRRIIKPVKSSKMIRSKSLSRRLLLLRDIPGINLKTIIRPGQSNGLSDLSILVDGKETDWKLDVNNFGSPHTKRTRIGASVQFYNLLGWGDSLGLQASSSGKGMQHGNLDYDVGLGDNSNHIGFGLGYLNYSVGGNLKSLGAKGTAKTLEAHWRHSWLRSLDLNIVSQRKVNHHDLDDEINNGLVETIRDLTSAEASVSMNSRGWLSNNSSSAMSLSLRRGQLSFGNNAARDFDAAGANTQNEFSVWNVQIQHWQMITQKFDAIFSLSCQQAENNLDTTQKIGLTGPYGVRAYEIGSLSADVGGLARLTLNYNLSDAYEDRLTLYGFVDGASAKINHQAWLANQNESRVNITGFGVGVKWQGSNWWADVLASTPLGSSGALIADNNKGLVWLEMGRSL